MNSLKAKIIKENLMIATIELGVSGVIDLLAETCDKIYAEGGVEVEVIKFRPELESWQNDAEELRYFKDNGRLST